MRSKPVADRMGACSGIVHRFLAQDLTPVQFGCPSTDANMLESRVVSAIHRRREPAQLHDHPHYGSGSRDAPHDPGERRRPIWTERPAAHHARYPSHTRKPLDHMGFLDTRAFCAVGSADDGPQPPRGGRRPKWWLSPATRREVGHDTATPLDRGRVPGTGRVARRSPTGLTRTFVLESQPPGATATVTAVEFRAWARDSSTRKKQYTRDHAGDHPAEARQHVSRRARQTRIPADQHQGGEQLRLGVGILHLRAL